MLPVLWPYKFAFIFIKVLVLTDLIKIRTLPMAQSHTRGWVLILIFFYCITLLSLLY